MATPYIGVYAASYPEYVLSGAVTPAPTITSFSPTSGLASSTLVITGTNFTGATLVSVNSGAVASFTVNSATQITAVLTSAQTTGLVRVTTAGGTAVSSGSFTVTAGSTKTTIYHDGDSIMTNYADTGSPAIGEYVHATLGDTQYQGWRIPAFPGQRTDEMLYRLQNGGAGSPNSGGGTYTGSTLPTLNGAAGIVAVEICINDAGQIATSNGQATDRNGQIITQARIQQNIIDYIVLAKSKGWKVLLVDQSAARNTDQPQSVVNALDATRQTTNTWALNNWQAIGAEGLVRVSTDYRLGTLDATYSTVIYADAVHLKGAGRQIYANLVAQGIQQIMLGSKPVIVGDPGTGTRIVQENQLNKSGQTDDGTASNPDGSTYYGANGPNTILSYNQAFSGSSLEITYVQNEGGWDAVEVLVDGTKVGEINQQGLLYYFKTATFAIPAGNHTSFSLRVKAGAGHGGAAQGTITFDMARAYTGTVSPAPTPVPGGVASAPATGFLFIEAEDNSAWNRVGTSWGQSTGATYHLNALGEYSTAFGEKAGVRVYSRFVDLFSPSDPSLGVLSLTVTRASDGVVMGTQQFNQAALGTQQKEGYPDDATPTIRIDTGAVDIYDVLVANISGIISYGCIRLSR